MNELVFIQNDQALTTSLKIAEVFEKRHDRVLRAIENAMGNLPQNGDVKKAFIKDTYKDEKGEHRPMYYLNRDGFSFVVMGFNNTPQVAKWKWGYIQAFNLMEKTLIELLEKRKSAEWQEARNASRRGWRPLTDAIKKLAELAHEQGSKTEEKFFYMAYARLMNKMLHIKAGNRDKIESWQNYELEKFEFILKCILDDKVPTKENHKKIYATAKQALENYCELSFINQRFITGNDT